MADRLRSVHAAKESLVSPHQAGSRIQLGQDRAEANAFEHQITLSDRLSVVRAKRPRQTVARVPLRFGPNGRPGSPGALGMLVYVHTLLQVFDWLLGDRISTSRTGSLRTVSSVRYPEQVTARSGIRTL